MNYRMIAYLLGYIMRIEALFMLPALGISLYGCDSGAVQGFLVAIVLLMGLSLPVRKRPQRRDFYAKEGLMTVGLAWIVVSLCGALPFWISGEVPGFIDCLFETVSGFTTTGASILPEVEALSKGLLYWRSFTHWLGGMGVLVFILAIIPMADSADGNSLHLLRAESPGPQVSKLMPKMRDTAKVLYGIYVALTVLQIIFLLAGGMSFFDSITTAFGTAGTGGFGVKNDSMASYSIYLQVVTAVFMMLFGINFNVFYLLMIREWSKAIFHEEMRTYLGIMVTSVVVITADLMYVMQESFGSALHLAAFQVSSIMTTTGFATADFNLWPQLSRTILVILMILGACAGSTGGGVKIARVIILFKAAKNNLLKVLRPRQMTGVRMDGEIVEEETVNGVYGYMTVYAMIAILSVLLISWQGFSFETNVTAVLACINNIGPGLDLVGPMGNFSMFSGFNKIVLLLNMLIGRLEIFPVLLLFSPKAWHRR